MEEMLHWPAGPRDTDGMADVLELRSLENIPTNTTTFTNLEVDGNSVTFRQELRFPDGTCLSGDGQRVTVEDGKITRYDWGATGEPCE